MEVGGGKGLFYLLKTSMCWQVTLPVTRPSSQAVPQDGKNGDTADRTCQWGRVHPACPNAAQCLLKDKVIQTFSRSVTFL